MLDENGQPGPMQVYPPVNLYDEKLRSLVKALGPAWVRVSGTWATKAYYDFDGTTGGTVPEGYLNILTKEQWIGVLAFIRDTCTKLMVSVANCPGLHSAHEPWVPTEAEKKFALSEEYGVPIDAAEFVNEPNMMEMSGFPEGYTPEDYRRDQDLFFSWLDEHYPYVLKVGPSSTGRDFDIGKNGGIENLVPNTCDCAALMDGIIFHNTLCSSDYGFLKHGTFDPRPNYFAVLLWNRLIGPIVYESGEPIREGAHVYARSRKDGKKGLVYVVINNSLTDETTVLLPKAAEVYALAGEGGNMRAPVMMYPYITLADGTEIVHSHIIEKEDGQHIPHDCQFFPEPKKQRLLPRTAG